MPAITLPTTTKGSVGVSRESGISAVDLAQGQIVYQNTSRRLDLARANASSTINVAGVVEQSVTAGTPCTVVRNGLLTGLTDIVVGEVYCLAPGTAGAIIPHSELVAGDYVVVIGVGVSPTSIQLGIINTVVQVPGA